MKRLVLLALVGAILLHSIPTLSDDGFYVIAVGGGVGTKITSLPYTITQPGFYYLKDNLSTSLNGIIVNANEVTLDLMGFSITGPGSTSGQGIYINGVKNVEVRNGNLKNFQVGIWATYDTETRNFRLANIKVRGCNTGIQGDAYGTVITCCEATTNVTGILSNAYGGLIDKNTSSFNSSYGFLIDDFKGIVTNNTATDNGKGFSFQLSNNPETLVDRNSSSRNGTNWENFTDCTKGLNTP